MQNQRIVRKSYPNINKFTLPLISISKNLFSTFFTDHKKNFRWHCTFETRLSRFRFVPVAFPPRDKQQGHVTGCCDSSVTLRMPSRQISCSTRPHIPTSSRHLKNLPFNRPFFRSLFHHLLQWKLLSKGCHLFV